MLSLTLKLNQPWHFMMFCMGSTLVKAPLRCAVIKINLEKELAHIEQPPLHINYLDRAKAHDTIDCDQALKMFEEHRRGQNMLHVMNSFWKGQKVVATVEEEWLLQSSLRC